MTIDTLIDTILAGTEGEAAYTAYDAASRAAANARGQILDVRANAVLDVVKRDLLTFSRHLTDGGRAILEGLRTQAAPAHRVPPRPHPFSRDGHLHRLAASKPTQTDLATAARVLRWLSDHAHFFPDEYGEEAAYTLAQAANACGADPAELLLTAEAYAERDAHNARVAAENADA